MYSKAVRAALEKAGIGEGDALRLTVAGRTFEGTLLPAFAQEGGVLVLKLKSGYNVGLALEASAKLEKLPGERRKPGQIPKTEFPPSFHPSISLLATGGTIGTHVDYRTGAVFMSRTPEEVLGTTPELQEFTRVHKIASPFRLASEDLQPVHWKAMAESAAELLNDPECRGLLVTHGTDTLHYSSAALSFMLEGLGKPVAFVGAQRSPDRGSFDGRLNLQCAARYCLSDFAEVAVVMHGQTSDDFCLAHRGTKVRKMHTSARNAFQSVNDSPLARVFPDGKIEKLNSRYRLRSDAHVKADARFEEKTALLKLYPGASPELLRYHQEKGYRGVVLEAFALGHVPTGQSGVEKGGFDEAKNWIPAVKDAVDAGLLVAVASQTLFGRVHPAVYRNLRLLAQAGAVFCSDVLPETAYVKLGCALGREKSADAAASLMKKIWAFESNDRLTQF